MKSRMWRKRNVSKKGCELPEPDNSNTLYLVIKQVYFDQIIAGTKTEEYREVKYSTYKKYVKTEDDGSVMFSDAISDEELSKYQCEDDLNIYNNGVCPLIPKELVLSESCSRLQ